MPAPTEYRSRISRIHPPDLGTPKLSPKLAMGLLAIICFLAPLTDVKYADLQTVELFGAFVTIVAFSLFIRNGFRFAADPVLIGFVKSYALLVAIISGLALASLRLEVFPPFQLSLLKSPPILSLSRIFQLLICITLFLSTTLILRNRPQLLRSAAKFYVWAGLLSAAYAIGSSALWAVGVELSGAYSNQNIRARGFFVEGGPFGIYLVSTALVAHFRHRIFAVSRLETFSHLATLGLALALAQSKAAILLLFGVFFLDQFFKRRYFRLSLAALVGVPVLAAFVMLGGISGYIQNYARFEEAAQERPEDTSLVMGRLMASIMVPRMIVEHPVLGIGIGNYSLQRNNPEFLQGLPTTDRWDLPGLGFLGYAAELGIPCLLMLMWLIWRPVKLSQGVNVDSSVALMASFQFLAHLFGAQVTFIYPWVVSAFALGFVLAFRPTATHQLNPSKRSGQVSLGAQS